jgi:hypothetical protein
MPIWDPSWPITRNWGARIASFRRVVLLMQNSLTCYFLTFDIIAEHATGVNRILEVATILSKYLLLCIAKDDIYELAPSKSLEYRI